MSACGRSMNQGVLSSQGGGVDVAFLVYYYEDGSVGILIILHVDDIMISNDGTKHTEAIVKNIYEKYPFGEWVKVRDKTEGVTYTGRTMWIVGKSVHMNQKEFIDGRMILIPRKKHKGRALDDACTEIEKADFKSGTGDLHWVTSQTRLDHAVDTSRLQKRQVSPTYGDYLDLARVVKEGPRGTSAASTTCR